MNHLQSYLRLKGISAQQIHLATGLGYHAVVKTIKGVRKGRVVRQAIADYLQVPYEHIWGTGSARHLKRMIQQAINDRAQAENRRLQQRYLDKSLTESRAASNG